MNPKNIGSYMGGKDEEVEAVGALANGKALERDGILPAVGK